MVDDSAPITREEMVELFGEEHPPEAVDLIWHAPMDWTFGQVRAELRKIAASRKGNADGQG